MGDRPASSINGREGGGRLLLPPQRSLSQLLRMLGYEVVVSHRRVPRAGAVADDLTNPLVLTSVVCPRPNPAGEWYVDAGWRRAVRAAASFAGTYRQGALTFTLEESRWHR